VLLFASVCATYKRFKLCFKKAIQNSLFKNGKITVVFLLKTLDDKISKLNTQLFMTKLLKKTRRREEKTNVNVPANYP